MTGAKTPLHDVMSDVETKSRGDDLDGIVLSSRRTSASVTGSKSDRHPVDGKSDDRRVKRLTS